MGKMNIRLQKRLRRKQAIRKRISGTTERPRLCVFKSSRHIYAQIVDDIRGHSLAAASTVMKGVPEDMASLKPVQRARIVGEILAERCKALGIEKVVMDRNGFKYHGRIKAVAEGARAGGLEF